MISRSRRDSVGGGSSTIVTSSREADQIRWGGGSSRISPRVLQEPTRFGGGRVVAGIFSDLHKRNHNNTPN